MKKLIVICFLLCFTAVPAQDISKDTVELHEVLIDKKIRKPKIKKIKIGRHRESNYISNALYFDEDSVFYLTDSLPFGHIQQISLFFLTTSFKFDPELERYKNDSAKKTQFEVTLYEVCDNYSVGKQVNNEPIPIVLEGGKHNTVVLQKIELDLSSYNFKANRFFISLKKITDTTCEDCYFYTPALYKTKDGYHYISKQRKEVYKKLEPDCYDCLGLQMTVKTLTQEH